MDPFPAALDLLDAPGARLRLLEPDDWRLEYDLARVPDVPRWTMYPADLDEYGARLRVTRMNEAARAGKGIRYAVEQDGKALGTAGFGRSPDGFEVFYALKPEGRGRGLATASVRSLVAWLAAQGERAVHLSTLDGNAASEAVARRAGFRRERSGTYADGRPLTVWLYRMRDPLAD